MDHSVIDNAVILATGRIFHRPGEPAPSSPLTSVGGLSLFQRTLFTLQRGGISRLVVLAGDETETLKGQIQGDMRVKADVRWLPVTFVSWEGDGAGLQVRDDNGKLWFCGRNHYRLPEVAL